jgi:single-strand DNA-binding protein
MQLRVVVPRDLTARRRVKSGSGPAASSRVQTVDTIDLVCWTATTRRSAGRLTAGQTVEVRGALRRRFFGGPAGRQSRYEVEVAALRRVSETVPTDT